MIKPIRCSTCGTILQRRHLYQCVESGKSYTCPNSNCLRVLTADQIEEALVNRGEITYYKPEAGDAHRD